MTDRVGQVWTNNRSFFLCISSREPKLEVWRHTFVDLELADTHIFEESEKIDWQSKELSYWKRML